MSFDKLDKKYRFKLVEQLSDGVSNHLFHWRESVFPVEGDEFEWVNIHWHLLAFDGSDEMPCAHLGYKDFDIQLDGISVVKVVGVGDVVVRPEYQGQHIPARLFEILHGSKHANSLADTLTLFCPNRLESYYNRHGYQKFTGDYTFNQNSEVVGTDKFALMVRGKSIAAKQVHIEGNPW